MMLRPLTSLARATSSRAAQASAAATSRAFALLAPRRFFASGAKDSAAFAAAKADKPAAKEGGGKKLDFVFYSDSGSTAIEVALKMAIGFHENKSEKRHFIVH